MLGFEDDDLTTSHQPQDLDQLNYGDNNEEDYSQDFRMYDNPGRRNDFQPGLNNPMTMSKLAKLQRERNDNSVYSDRSHYEREKNKGQDVNFAKAKQAQMQDLSDQLEISKKEYSGLLENSAKCRETALETLLELNKSAVKERNHSFVFAEANRQSLGGGGGGYLGKLKEGVKSKVRASYSNQPFKPSKEELKKLLSPQDTFYEENMQNLTELNNLINDMIAKDNSVIVLKNIIDLINEKIDYDSKDLKQRVDTLEEDITTIDQGTTKLQAKAEYMKSKVGNLSYLGPLTRLIDKIQKINSSNLNNAAAKDQIRTDLKNHRDELSSKNPRSMTPDDIPYLRDDLQQIESNLGSLEEIRTQHLDRYFDLVKEQKHLKSEIETEYERLVREIQK